MNSSKNTINSSKSKLNCKKKNKKNCIFHQSQTQLQKRIKNKKIKIIPLPPKNRKKKNEKKSNAASSLAKQVQVILIATHQTSVHHTLRVADIYIFMFSISNQKHNSVECRAQHTLNIQIRRIFHRDTNKKWCIYYIIVDWEIINQLQIPMYHHVKS